MRHAPSFTSERRELNIEGDQLASLLGECNGGNVRWQKAVVDRLNT